MACQKGNLLAFTDEIYELAAVENRIKYYSNPVAQNYRKNQVLKSLYTDCITDKNEHKYAKGERPNEVDKV